MEQTQLFFLTISWICCLGKPVSDHIDRELRNSLDTVRLQTDKQASYHLNLAQQIKTDLEGPTAAFVAKQTHHKKNIQAHIEKEFRSKQLQEGYVNKAKEKYETDCRRINTYTAEATLVQGKELEKIQLKLERAQQTVQANERDFSNFAKALQDTVQKWEQSWKEFCDTCQDLEEERLEFTKDCMWGSTNAVAAVCVQDDEVCMLSATYLPNDISRVLATVVRENTSRSRAIGARKGYGGLRPRLWNWKSDTRPTSVCQLCRC